MAPPSVDSRRYAVVLMVLLLVALPFGTTVAVAQFDGGAASVVIDEGETVESVDAVAGTVVVHGTVTGDLSGVAGSVRITDTGEVGGDLDASAGSVIIAGEVDGNVRIGAGSFEMEESGYIGGDLDVGAGHIHVDGTIDGNVRAGGGSIVIGPNANVGGEFRYDAEQFTQSPDAVIEGGVVQDSELGIDSGLDTDSLIPAWFGSVYSLAASLLFGIVLLAVFPRFSNSVATRAIEKPVTAGGVGFLTLLAVPIILILIAITIVGIPLALIGIGLYILALWTGIVYGKYAVGVWILGLLGQDNRWLALVVGLVGFTLLDPVPIVGSLIDFLALLLGLGALAIGLRDLRRDTTVQPE